MEGFPKGNRVVSKKIIIPELYDTLRALKLNKLDMRDHFLLQQLRYAEEVDLLTDSAAQKVRSLIERFTTGCPIAGYTNAILEIIDEMLKSETQTPTEETSPLLASVATFVNKQLGKSVAANSFLEGLTHLLTDSDSDFRSAIDLNTPHDREIRDSALQTIETNSGLRVESLIRGLQLFQNAGHTAIAEKIAEMKRQEPKILMPRFSTIETKSTTG